MSEEAIKVLPVLPLKNTVLFPYLLMPFRSAAALRSLQFRRR